MLEIEKRLLDAGERDYAAFASKLAPTIEKDCFIGVRVPELRKIAKEYRKQKECERFLCELPHRYYDENLLHAILLAEMKDYCKCMEAVERFLPYVDNWAVCDTLRPKAFEKHKDDVFCHIQKWVDSEAIYTCRFGIDMLMTYFLEDDFKPGYLEMISKVNHEDYYVRTMVAWYFATALAKQWESTIAYLEGHVLPEWTHKKAIQKACESRRIADRQKCYLRSLLK